MMKRLGSALVTALAVALVAPMSASANHTFARGTVEILRGETVVANYDSGITACSGTSCQPDVVMNGRDWGRVSRWCGTVFVPVLVAAGNLTGGVACFGGGSWTIVVHGFLSNAHDSNVTITVSARKQ